MTLSEEFSEYKKKNEYKKDGYTHEAEYIISITLFTGLVIIFLYALTYV